MFHQTIVGKPKCCLNRNCKSQFFKTSHLGWLPKSEVEVYAIMKMLKMQRHICSCSTYFNGSRL